MSGLVEQIAKLSTEKFERRHLLCIIEILENQGMKYRGRSDAITRLHEGQECVDRI